MKEDSSEGKKPGRKPQLPKLGRETDVILREAGYVYLVSSINEEALLQVSRRILAMGIERQQLNISKPIHLFISSGGGDVASGLALIETIERVQRDFKIPVHSHAVGFAMSMAAYIHQAAAFRTMGRKSFLMFHDVRFSVGGGPSEIFEDWRSYIERERELLFELVTRRTGYKDVAFWRSLAGQPGRSSYLSAEESLQYGLIDAIDE